MRRSVSVEKRVSNFLEADPYSEIVYVSPVWASTWINEYQYLALSFPIPFLSSLTYKIELDASLGTNEIRLASWRLLKDFGTDFTIEKVVATPVRLPKLREISIVVPPSIYIGLADSINSAKGCAKLFGLLEKERGESNSVLIRKGDFIGFINGRVVHCEDWDQGYIDRTTNLVLIKGSDRLDSYELARKEPLNVFSTQLACKEMLLKIELLEANELLNCTTAGSYITQFPYEDETILFGVHYVDLVSMHCFAGDAVEIIIDEKLVYGRVFPFVDPNCYSKGSIYISPLLRLSLKHTSEVTVRKYTPEKMSTIYAPSSIPVTLALDVCISRVASKVTLDKKLQRAFLSELKSYFESKKRVITLGQLIPIAFDKDIAKMIWKNYDSKGEDSLHAPDFIPKGNVNAIAYFQITEGQAKNPKSGAIEPLEEGKQYFVSPHKSRMIQKGVVSDDAITSLINSQFDCNTVAKYLSIETPFVYRTNTLKNVFSYADTLRKIMRTGFQGQSAVKTTAAIISSTRSVGKTTLVRSVTSEFGATLLEFDAHELQNYSPGQPAAMIGYIKGKCDRVVESCNRIVLYFRHLDSLCKVGDEGSSDQKSTDETIATKFSKLFDEYISKGIIILCSCLDIDNLNETIRGRLVFEIEVKVPNEMERLQMFKHFLNFATEIPQSAWKREMTDEHTFVARNDVSLSSLAMQSAALTPSDILSIVKNVKINALERVKKASLKLNITVKELILVSGGVVLLIPSDFETSINNARSKFSDSIGAPRIPNVKWQDVGGLDMVKSEIFDTIDMPLKHPELFGSGMKKRSGILFYGPPGTGKTLLAKAIATNFSLNFFSVKGPELLNMYIGESEANVRRVFEKARDAKPCVVFFDELDSVAPKRGNQGDAGGVMDRIVSQLLAELDGMSDGDGGDGVFVVGASNRPDLLDEALLRPGRFDKMLYLGISDTHDKQAKILEALTRKFPLSGDVDLGAIANQCPFNFTGADFYALCSDAMLAAMVRTAKAIEQRVNDYNLEAEKTNLAKLTTRQWFDRIASTDDLVVQVKQADLACARADLVPSVSVAELHHYETVRDSFEGKK